MASRAVGHDVMLEGFHGSISSCPIPTSHIRFVHNIVGTHACMHSASSGPPPDNTLEGRMSNVPYGRRLSFIKVHICIRASHPTCRLPADDVGNHPPCWNFNGLITWAAGGCVHLCTAVEQRFPLRSIRWTQACLCWKIYLLSSIFTMFPHSAHSTAAGALYPSCRRAVP